MSNSDHPVVIVGGGVAGLTAALRIHRAGIAFRLLEARSRLGGRVLTADEAGQVSSDGFDLGPSWFWPEMQPAFGRLVADFGLASFGQHDDGDVVLQRMPHGPPQRYSGLTQAPPSMRLAGGTASIASALADALPEESIELGVRATGARLDDEDVELSFVDIAGAVQTCRATVVVFALPPRLLEATVAFSPAIDPASASRWRATPTWMAPHAKFFAVYDRPFWREQGLSGTAQSMVGPLAEIHDATTASGKAALFGFLGISTEDRAAAGESAIVAACVRQLADIFGLEAAKPRATLFKDWAADPLTATGRDRIATGHPMSDRRPWVGQEWRDRIVLAGSESSSRDPGYLAGAVDAAERAAAFVIARLQKLARRNPLSPATNV
ncbi:flavin monoamine oxidase family protein [Bradyrhizobium sp.]|uniref:flavin monoamine oxidase family protein n=1 Tax=Bradyrhizobium sp. TaxID=376 RepID=UPI002C1B05A0|nr:FAD-dependent oxidoreductase [Bradyrhizobium sp.]HMM89337.1 FAD-dependent oxidoreductase [Bradyrhizobium sp.]